MEANKLQASEILAASQNTNAAATNAAVPTETVTLAARMSIIDAQEMRYTASKREGSERGSLGLFDEDGGLLEVWTCSKTVSHAFEKLIADTTLTEEAKRIKAHRYANTLVLMWVTAQNGDVMQIVSESRDFSNAFCF